MLMIIAINQSNFEHRTTYQSFFIVANASSRQFFRVTTNFHPIWLKMRDWKSGLNDFHRPQIFFKSSHIIKCYFSGTNRITAVLESKRNDRATPQSLFIAPNVSPRCFFGFHTPYEQFSLKMLQKEDVSEEQVDLWVDVKNFLEASQCYSLFLQTYWWS